MSITTKDTTNNVTQQEQTKAYSRSIAAEMRKRTPKAEIVVDEEKAGVYAAGVKLALDGYDASDTSSLEDDFAYIARKHKQYADIFFESDNEYIDPTLTVFKDKTILKTMSILDALNLEDIDWLVAGKLQKATVSCWVGEGAVGKTFVVLDLMMCMAYDMDFLGNRTMGGNGLYVYAEGSAGIKQRSLAWLIAHGKYDPRDMHIARKSNGEPYNPYEDITDKIEFIPRPVHLLSDIQMLCDTIEAYKERKGVYPAIVAIDTFSMCSSGINENDNGQVAQHLASAARIKHLYGCHVIVVHHCNKNGNFRGASAFRDNVDTMIGFERDRDDEPIKMRCLKQKDGAPFPDTLIKLEQVTIGRNKFTDEPITSCVIRPVETFIAEAEGSRLPKKCINMLTVLNMVGEINSTAWKSAYIKEMELASASSFYDDIKWLSQEGYVSFREIEGARKGSSAKNFYKITQKGKDALV